MPRQTRSLLFACAGLLLAAAPSRAAEPAPASLGRVMDLTYEVYLGGMHIFSMDVDMALRPSGYTVAAEGGTRGMIGWLYKWDIKVAAEGRDDAGAIRPSVYQSAMDWQKNPRTTRLSFAERGAYDVQRTPVEEKPDPDDDNTLPSQLPENTVDPLSLAVAATRALAANGQCAQTLPVFDGKRRYDLTIKDLGPATIAPNRYSIYSGPATRCGFTIERISGFNKKYSRSRWDQDKEAPPTMWMAQVHDGVPPVPVRYEGAIALGNMVIHLTKAEVRAEVAQAAP